MAVIPDTKDDDIAVFSIIPKATNALGFSFEITCEKEVFCVDYEINSDQIIANKAGRASV
jgi:hypothetical protein